MESFSEAYVLAPGTVREFIAAGQEKAARYTRNLKDVRALVDTFVSVHDRFFFKATRNNPKNVTVEERRNMLQMAIIGAAALCAIAKEIRQTAKQDKEDPCGFLSNGKKRFYEYHSQRETHPKVLSWLDATMTTEEKTRRPEIVAALHDMFPPATKLANRHNKKLRADRTCGGLKAAS